MDLIIRRCNNLFGHLDRLGNDTPAHQTLHAVSTSLLDVFLVVLGNVLQVAQGARFVLITISHLLIYGDVLSIEVILG